MLLEDTEEPMLLEESPRVPPGTWIVGFMMVCVSAAALLFAARQPSPPTEVGQVPASQWTTAKAAAMEVDPALFQPVSTIASGAAAQAPVTIAGCLEERKDQTFRLKDTTGVDAPKSRSWRSGFFKKSSTSIDLVDAADRVKLHTHAGQQISVTGMLTDREMQVRSLQRVAKSCD